MTLMLEKSSNIQPSRRSYASSKVLPDPGGRYSKEYYDRPFLCALQGDIIFTYHQIHHKNHGL